MKFHFIMSVHIPNCLFILWYILIAPHLIWVSTANQGLHPSSRKEWLGPSQAFDCSQMATYWINSVLPSFVTIYTTDILLASVLLTAVFLACIMVDGKSPIFKKL